MRRVLFSLTVLLAFVPALMAQPDTLPLDYRVGPGAPMPIRGHEDHYAYLFNSVSVTGEKWTGLVRVSNPRNGSLVLPALRQKEIVPAFGTLYRHELGRLTRLKEAPKGLAVGKDSFVVPLMRGGQGSGQIGYQGKIDFEWTMVLVTEISKKKVAKVKLADIRKEAQEVRVGDVLKFGPTEWKVLSIVPARSEAIGWVELAQKGK